MADRLLSMAHLPRRDQSQLLLSPGAVEAYVGPDNTVRLIEPFVAGFDLAAVGLERVTAKEAGWDGFDPSDMLILQIYGYLNRVRSSRHLRIKAHRNIEAIWLLLHLKPDFLHDHRLSASGRQATINKKAALQSATQPKEAITSNPRSISASVLK